MGNCLKRGCGVSDDCSVGTTCVDRPDALGGFACNTTVGSEWMEMDNDLLYLINLHFLYNIFKNVSCQASSRVFSAQSSSSKDRRTTCHEC